MSDVTLKNTSPLGDIQIPFLGIDVIKSGAEFTVPAEVAGRAPELDKDGEVTDLGTGLLAQIGNFELVKSKTEKKD